ncbi:hypothetical protein ELI43_24355 [Rhizobium leguminosarum]|uniref:hypothetical protein n=1 Tax=Rhizobium leguminosarum TaxID=384 RepID=UPI00103020DE|nr:hypothetical protein [Rhizobium leguminosarum]TAU55734.1 hypothetical protein ELI43_24355 [Rhizobium leguminosarum]
MNDKLTAEQDLKTRLGAIRALGGNDPAEINATIARNILHEDLGRFEGDQTIYGLDQVKRDRLLAHARQDAALAVLGISTITNEVRGLNRKVSFLIALVVAVLALELLRFF